MGMEEFALKTFVKWAIASIASISMLGVAFYFYLFFGADLHDYLVTGGEFDPVRWKEAAIATGDRIRMADLLLEREELVGLTRQEVLSMLGTPGGLKESDVIDAPQWTYALGPEQGFVAISHEWLVLEFDENGVVKTARKRI